MLTIKQGQPSWQYLQSDRLCKTEMLNIWQDIRTTKYANQKHLYCLFQNDFITVAMPLHFSQLWRQYSTHSAMSGYPQEAATCSGVHPSLSAWFTLASCSTRKDTISILPSMQACVEDKKQTKIWHRNLYECLKQTCFIPDDQFLIS